MTQVLSHLCRAFFQSPSDLLRAGEVLDKTSQIAEYEDTKSPRNKASKIQKLAVQCFMLMSAKVKKFQDGD